MRAVAVEGKVDIGRDRVRVVYPQHALRDECSFVLVAEGQHRLINQVVNAGDLPVCMCVCV